MTLLTISTLLTAITAAILTALLTAISSTLTIAALTALVSAIAALIAAVALAFGPASEKLHIVRNHLSHITFVAGLILPTPRAEPTFNINLRAFFHVLLNDVGQIPPKDHIMPFSGLAGIAFTVAIPLSRGKPKRRHLAAGTGLNITNFRIRPDIPNQHNFIKRHYL